MVTARPGDAVLRGGLGRALAQAGQLAEAANELRAALEAGDGVQDPRDLAAVLYHRGDLAEAERWFAAAAQWQPRRSDVDEALARLQYRRDAVEAAAASCERARAGNAGLAQRLNIGFVRCRTDAGATSVAASAAAVRAPGADGPGTHTDALRQACEVRSLLVFGDFIAGPVAYRELALALP